ncbi:MAG: DUF2029 domain-containing protein [Clostridiales bacterium]|nr:DUF2029 domain-containing protein [Clostridiales bacterium]
MAVHLLIIGLLSKRFLKENFKGGFKYFIIMASSAAILYPVLWGNIVLTAYVFLLAFFTFYKSEKKALRELSLICLCIAGILKLYIFLFGIFLLKEKKFKEILRCVLYTAILAFVPFLFYEGGFSNIPLYISNLFNFATDYNRFLPTNFSIQAGFYSLFITFFNDDALYFLGDISLSLVAIVFIMTIICSLITKSDFKRALMVSFTSCLVPSVSYYHSAIIFLIPLLYFFKEFDNLTLNKRAFYFFVFFITTFALIIAALSLTVLHTYIMLLALFIEYIDILSSKASDKKIMFLEGSELNLKCDRIKKTRLFYLVSAIILTIIYLLIFILYRLTPGDIPAENLIPAFKPVFMAIYAVLTAGFISVIAVYLAEKIKVKKH